MKIFRMLFVMAFAPLVLVGCNSENASTGACTVSNTPTMAGNVIFRVTSLPSNHPADEAPFLAGTMNKWAAGSDLWKLAKNCDGTYQVEVPFAKAGDIALFKFTRGSWPKVEVDANGYDVADRKVTYSDQTLINFTVAKWADLEGGSKGKAPTATGDIRFEDVTLGSGTRKLRIYLPPDYTTNTSKNYPVLYMFDGQNLFDEKTAGFGSEWKVDETLEQFAKDGVTDGVIVVGIDNEGTGKGRYEEYTNWDWTHPTVGAITARGDETATWLVNTVIPFVNGKYRTLTGRANTGLAGSSMGGYMTIYTGLAYPDVFGKLASFSTVALDDPMQGQNLRAYVEAAKTDGTKSPYIADTTVYIDIGDQEDLSYTTRPLLVDNHTQMCASLTTAGYAPTCSVITGGVHNEGAWSKRFGDVFKLLFPKAS